MTETDAATNELAELRRSYGMTREEFGIALSPNDPHTEHRIRNWETMPVSAEVIRWATAKTDWWIAYQKRQAS